MERIVETVGRGELAKGGEPLCRILTLNRAQATSWESELGSIRAGKKANFHRCERGPELRRV